MPSVAVGCARLHKLANFLDKLPNSHFRFDAICYIFPKSQTNKCGTVGCAMGWTPTVFPKLIGVQKSYHDHDHELTSFFMRTGNVNRDKKQDLEYDEAAVKLFGIPGEHARAVFAPGSAGPQGGPELSGGAHPSSVAKRLRAYAKWWMKQSAAEKEYERVCVTSM